MKKYFLLICFFLLVSCNYILKNYKEDTNNMVLDTTKTNTVTNEQNLKSCDLKAGYKWSNLQNKCIRVFELGYRMSSVEKDSLGKSDNAYFFIDADSLKAEVFLPDSTESIVMERKNEESNFKHKNYQLKTRKGYLIYTNNQVSFKPALAKDLKTVGKDEEY